MPACPNCNRRLHRLQTKFGMIHACTACDGRMVGLAVLRKERMTREFFRTVWPLSRKKDASRGRLCPHCNRPMAVVDVPFSGGDDPFAPLVVDVCNLCMGIWFDPEEHGQVPKEPAEEIEELAPEAREALAMERIRRIRERAELEMAAEGPEKWWQIVPAVLRFPVETSAPEIKDRPLATWVMVALCILVFAVSAGVIGLERAVRAWGFVPDEWARHGGLTLLTSLLLHGGVLHLLGNMYFLWVFGDNVEDDLGRWRFVLLILVSDIVGTLAHSTLDPRQGIPVVGASAGISGVLAYYGVAFPRAQVGVVFWFWYVVRWIRLPAWAFLVAWIALQVLGALEQVGGMTSVSAIGHLGGASVGLLVALSVRARRRRLLKE